MARTSGPVPEWVYGIDVAAVPSGHAAHVQIGERSYAVCHDAGRFVVVGNSCPHAQGSLGRGEVVDGCIICPVHHWPWDLRTGLTDSNFPHMRLTFYRHEVRQGKVYIDVSGPVGPERLGWDEGRASARR